MPDSSLLLYGFSSPFIVCEVAVSKTLKSVMAKKRPYLLGSQNQVRFLVIIYLGSEKPSLMRKRSHDGVHPQSNKRGPIQRCGEPVDPPIEEASLESISPQHKSGYVFVYTTTVQESKKDPTRRIRSIKTVVDNLEFWPAVPTGSLVLTWSDILGSDIGIPDDAKGKEVKIPYEYLHHLLSDFLLAQENASVKIVPDWKDGNNVDPKSGSSSDSPDESGGEVTGDSETEGDGKDKEWTPGGY